MRVLVGCEYSGVIRDAFENEGWDAYSCDIVPTQSGQTKRAGKHIQDDLLNHLDDGWDMLIAHPPCTYLSYAGMRSWNDKGRIKKRLEALEFFRKLWEANISHICLENPKSCASPTIAKYTQQIQPCYFGDPYLKTTWLWLKNLPPLTYTSKESLFAGEMVEPKARWCDCGGKRSKERLPAVVHDAMLRAITFHGVACAMAEQWSEYLKEQKEIEKEYESPNQGHYEI